MRYLERRFKLLPAVFPTNLSHLTNTLIFKGISLFLIRGFCKNSCLFLLGESDQNENVTYIEDFCF